VRPYYEQDGITIYHGDCREVLPAIGSVELLVTDPPYPNNAGLFLDGIASAREVLAAFTGAHALVFWHELEVPPCRLPLVAKHIWHRSNVNGRPYEPIYEFAIDGRKRRSDVMSAAAVFGGVGPGCSEYEGHPTQKNKGVMRWLIGKTPEGVVVDPFMGSGTTLVAARECRRLAIGIEAEERYCEIAARRLEEARAQQSLPLEASA
jgi:DNA modification methylase